MRSLFRKFKAGSKSAQSIADATGGLFRWAKLDSSIEELEEAPFAADFGYETTEEIIEKRSLRKR